MPTLPTGVVTFLFSDIEASTRMLEDHRAAAGPALARHHELLAADIAAQGGVVFETVGDAVYGAFARPADALAAAVAIQRSTQAEDWGEIGQLRVRIAVHTGAVETRGEHYFGAALFECARLQSLAHGGQTITSAATASLAATGLPTAITLSPLGRHRLKDLAEPMDVVQVDVSGLQTRFPPLRAAESVPNNLPSETTSFVGRDAELEQVGALLAEHRLVSLLGPGGTGKTRLAIETAARQLERFPDGAWLVELAAVSEPEMVVPEIAEIWGLRAGEGRSLAEVLTEYLASRHLLLVVDNCEHVREAAAAILGSVLRAAPRVSLIATSRETLGVSGETAYRVPSLDVPADEAEAERSGAVRLFLDRARAARPDFAATDTDMAAIVRVCRRLDGMPLGVELAAARLRTLSPTELAERLDTSFRILSGGSKSPDPRRRTLQATIDWSYDLLTPDEQTVFRRLSVFAGGFDVAAAEAVCACDAVEEWEVLDHLDALVDRSLVVATHGIRSRFRLLEPIRQYAFDALAELGEADATRMAHARHFADLVREAEPHIRGHRQLEWSRRLDLDHDNLRRALLTLREAGAIDRYLDACWDLYQYWEHDGMHREGIEFTLAGLRAAADPEPRRVVRAWWEVAVLGLDITDPASVAHAEEGLALARALGDPGLIGRMSMALGAAIKNTTDRDDADPYLIEGAALWGAHFEPGFWDPAWERGQFDLIRAAFMPDPPAQRRAAFESAIARFRELGDNAMLALTLLVTNFLTGEADDDWIFANLEEARTIARANGYRQSLGHGLSWWANKMRVRGRGEEIRADLEEAATILDEIGDLPCSLSARLTLIGVNAAADRVGEARAQLPEVIRATTILPEPALLVRALDFSCLVALELDELELAARLLGVSEQTPYWGLRGAEVPAYRARLEAALPANELARLVAEGTVMSLSEAAEAVLAWAA